MVAAILGIAMTSIQDEIFNSVLSGDVEDLQQVLESYDATEESEETNLFGKVDEMGRNALLVASMLGKSSVVRELVKQGAKLDEQTVRGYTSLHLAACWGHLDTVKTLLELGADLKAKTFREESPLDLAKRYSQTDCIVHLTQAEKELEALIAAANEPPTATKETESSHQNPRAKHRKSTKFSS
ncbi:ankyrin repeat domain-containing protein 45 [Poecilia reticulata]|uniref:ankyrin repeat domain-containing protein 45 n=1 Tax=Poecilia reticulata TaxID=8081 RepID=UPI0004A2E77B|nr:PREDICTED: ankyrin repeat domain-containing protein 45 [Poecilia reticulata]